MRYRKLDADGDMRFGNQQADFYRDVPEAVGQAILTRLRLWKGEYFFDLDEGTPYQTAILGKGTEELIQPAMRIRVARTPGVVRIDSFSLVHDRDARSGTISTTATTQYGTTTIEGEV